MSHDTQHSLLLREDNSLECNLNRFWEVEPVEQSSMTAEQQACEEHFHIHNPTASWKICGQTSKMEPNQLETPREQRLHTVELKLERHTELKVQ